MKKAVIIIPGILLCAGGVSLIAWSIADDGNGGQETAAGVKESTFKSELESATAPEDAVSEEGSPDHHRPGGRQHGGAERRGLLLHQPR